MSSEDPRAGRPAAPPTTLRRSDLQYSPSYDAQPKPYHGRPMNDKKSSKLVLYLFTLFVLLSAALLAFALVVRPKTPRFRMTEVRVKSLTYSNNNNNNNSSSQPPAGSSSVSLNASLVAVITVSNPNFGRFDQDNTTVRVVYGGALVVGEKEVGPCRVGARGTRKVEVAISIGASSGVSGESGGVGGNFTRDVGSGLVKLRSYGRLSGKVDLMGSGVKRRRTGDMDCEMKLNLTSPSVQDLVCQ